MSLSPFFKSPFTDMTGAVVSHQWDGPCAALEMKTLDCLEAYGLDRGVNICQDLVKDFQECSTRHIETLRVMAMMKERDRQYAAGERSKEERYAAPPVTDSI